MDIFFLRGGEFKRKVRYFSPRKEGKPCLIFFTESALNPHPKRFLRPYPLLKGFLIGGSWVLKETPKKVELLISISPI
jgi:hypothetical protein